MSTTNEEENKAQSRRTFKELFSQGYLALAHELIAPDYLDHEDTPGRNNRGAESVRQVVMMLLTALPNLHYTIEELAAEGDTVACRTSMIGTHQGTLMRIPSTGRSVQQAQMHCTPHARDCRLDDHGSQGDAILTTVAAQLPFDASQVKPSSERKGK